MSKSEKVKIIFVILVTLISIIYFLPNLGEILPKQVLKILPAKKMNLGLDLQGGIHTILQVDINTKGKDLNWQKDAMQRALEIIRNRVDQFGVAEAFIQQQGKDKIIVQLPGIKDSARAQELIGRMAKLEFKLVAEDVKKKEVISQIDNFLEQKNKEIKFPFTSLLSPLAKYEEIQVIREKDLPEIKRYIQEAYDYKIISNEYDLLLGKPEEEEIKLGKIERLEKIVRLYLVNKAVSISGDDLEMASWDLNANSSDLESYNKPEVLLRLNKKGNKKFAQVTGENIGKCLAIILDDKVYSAPYIKDKIEGGNARISGNFTEQEANDLAIVLRAGALPAPVKIVENRSVGPSLGKDSIRSGILATCCGTFLVAIFMIFYYKLSGLIAIFVLLLNVLITISILSVLGATLTLPGIAGLALTVGMAIDANVLIFERIRDELKSGLSVYPSIQKGFSRAFSAIFDSNLTTLIAAFVLYEFGTGPIKGFAVTLSIGLITSMFTAVVLARIIMNVVNKKTEVANFSI